MYFTTKPAGIPLHDIDFKDVTSKSSRDSTAKQLYVLELQRPKNFRRFDSLNEIKPTH